MAKKPVKKAAVAALKAVAKRIVKPAAPQSTVVPANRIAASRKLASPVVGKGMARGGTPVKPATASAKRNGVVVVPSKASATVKPVNGKPALKPAKPSAPVNSKPSAPAAKATAAAAKHAVAVKSSAALKPVTRPGAAAPVAAAPTPSAKAAGKNSAAASAPVVAPVKPAGNGKPMLMQGIYASPALTKKGTFAPVKPSALPAKPIVKKKIIRPIEQPLVPVPPPMPQVTTSAKAAKNKAGLTQKELEFYRDLLLGKRRELLGDMSSMEREALRENSADLSNLPVHMADQGTDAYEQEFTLGLVEKDRVLLREINHALAKIQNGNYGICEGTGQPIGKPRLEAQPWARHGIEYARQMEKRQMMFRR